MTAPTPGKEPGRRWGWGGSLRRLWSFPAGPLALPSLSAWRRSLRAPRASAALYSLSLGARWPLPTSLRSWHLTLPRSRSSGRVHPCSPGRGARQMWLAGTPSLGADWAGRRRMVPFQGHGALPGLRGRLGNPFSAAASVCALPRTRVPPRGAGHGPGCSETRGLDPQGRRES